MKVSELIERLEALRVEHGDVEVWVPEDEANIYPVGSVEFQNAGREEHKHSDPKWDFVHEWPDRIIIEA